MSETRSGRSSPFLAVLVVSVLVSAYPMYWLQVQLHELRSKVTAEEALRYVPSGDFLEVAVLGYDNVVADFLWIRGVALFGEKYDATTDDRWYDWLFQLIDLATELDPLDRMMYKYGGLMLRVGGARVDQSSLIFHKGMEHAPEEYFLPFGIAMNYLEFKHDIRKAAEYMRLASTRANAPFYLRSLAATLLDRSQQGRAALLFLDEQLGMLEPGSLRYRAVEVKILEVKHDSGAQQLQRALAEYMSIYHRAPDSLRELHGRTWIGPLPEDPYGGVFILDKHSGHIRSSQYFGARARITREVGLGADDAEEAKGPIRVE